MAQNEITLKHTQISLSIKLQKVTKRLAQIIFTKS